MIELVYLMYLISFACIWVGWCACDRLLLGLGFLLQPTPDEKMHDAHHGLCRGDQQVKAARREQEIQRTATQVLLEAPSDKTLQLDQLRNQGLVRINNILQSDTAACLLRHVSESLEMALRRDDGEQLLGVMLCSNSRHDLKLDLGHPVVSRALQEAISNIGPFAGSLLRPPPELFELGAIIADPGAERQPIHPDTPWSPSPSVLTAFISLQDIDQTMGPTGFLQGTQDQPRFHDAYNEQDEEWARLIGSRAYCSPLLMKGDGILFDSRVLHFAQDCIARRRVLFYLSLRASGVGESWTGCGFDKPGTLLDKWRGKFFLAADHLRLEQRMLT